MTTETEYEYKLEAENAELRFQLSQMRKELEWERGRYPGKITVHWLRAAFDRVAAGEPESEVMADYGYTKNT